LTFVTPDSSGQRHYTSGTVPVEIFSSRFFLNSPPPPACRCGPVTAMHGVRAFQPRVDPVPHGEAEAWCKEAARPRRGRWRKFVELEGPAEGNRLMDLIHESLVVRCLPERRAMELREASSWASSQAFHPGGRPRSHDRAYTCPFPASIRTSTASGSAWT
jgi:hypothetical protein